MENNKKKLLKSTLCCFSALALVGTTCNKTKKEGTQKEGTQTEVFQNTNGGGNGGQVQELTTTAQPVSTYVHKAHEALIKAKKGCTKSETELKNALKAKNSWSLRKAQTDAKKAAVEAAKAATEAEAIAQEAAASNAHDAEKEKVTQYAQDARNTANIAVKNGEKACKVRLQTVVIGGGGTAGGGTAKAEVAKAEVAKAEVAKAEVAEVAEAEVAEVAEAEAEAEVEVAEAEGLAEVKKCLTIAEGLAKAKEDLRFSKIFPKFFEKYIGGS